MAGRGGPNDDTPELDAINPRSGHTYWRATASPTQTFFAHTAAAGKLVFVASEYHVYAFPQRCRTYNCHPLWTSPAVDPGPGVVGSPPLVDGPIVVNGRVFVVRTDNRLIAYGLH